MSTAYNSSFQNAHTPIKTETLFRGTEHQFGFPNGGATKSFEVTNYAAFLDVSQAFDTVLLN